MSYTRISLSLLALIALPSRGMENQAPAVTPQEEQVPLDAKNENESVVPVVEAQALPTITLHLLSADQADNRQEQKPAPKNAAQSTFEKKRKPWVGRLYSANTTTTVLEYCNALTEAPEDSKSKEIAAYNIAFGIDEIIKNAKIHNKAVEAPSSAMQTVLYTKPLYTERLGTMIGTCNRFDLKLQDKDLIKAYNHLKEEDALDLASLKAVFTAAQAGLQERKKIRNTIRKMTSFSDSVEYPSDDEKYSNKGLSDLVLTYTTPADTDKK
jgi:hypothetical protein